MIPKIVHYCWFGKKDKPEIVIKCIESWKKNLPNYEIIEWNEENFDFKSNKYALEAYKEGKFAFVSDFVRVKALYEYGGIYLDTDVEVFKPFDNLLNTDNCILGFEEKDYIGTSFIATPPKHKLILELLSKYKNTSFYDKNGSINQTTNVIMLTEILSNKGLNRNGKLQVIDENIIVYPQEYFSPYDYINCVSKVTEKTYCMHHFYVSWMNKSTRIKKVIKTYLVKFIGVNGLNKLRISIKGDNNA